MSVWRDCAITLLAVYRVVLDEGFSVPPFNFVLLKNSGTFEVLVLPLVCGKHWYGTSTL